MASADLDVADHEVRDSWSRIDAWLTSRCRPVPARPAADDARLAAVEAESRVALPAELRAWWRLTGIRADFWIPEVFAPMSLDDALETREIWLLVADQEGPAVDGNGVPEPRFLPELLPIAMSAGGDGLVVDLRAGESHGAVFLWDHEQWGLGVPMWASIDAMLQDVAVALETGAPALRGQAALGGAEAPRLAVIDASGYLNWQAAP
ncbi:SMI1/KNR4 family protein [Streptodolium elevatio]